jgi:hypothetical protein
MEMQFFWVADQVQHNLFDIHWYPAVGTELRGLFDSLYRESLRMDPEPVEKRSYGNSFFDLK